MKYHTIIIGAGPAGSFCAKILAQRGLNVLILDNSHFPREKTCGGLLSKKSMDMLGEDIVCEKIDSNKISGICLKGNDGKDIVEESVNTIGLVIKRKDFDNYLLERAIMEGAEFKDNCRFLYYRHGLNFYEVYTSRGTFKSEFLIGADGYYSTVAKVSGIRKRWARWEQGLAVTVNVPEDYIDDGMKNSVEFYFPGVLGGMGWCFPGKNFYNIGVGGAALDNKQIIRSLKNLLIYKIKNENIVKKLKCKAAFLPAGGKYRKISDGKVLLIGDAAGLVDPFSGEGIYYALRSASIAADVIASGLKSEEYEKSCYSTFLSEFRFSALLSIILGNRKIIFERGLQQAILNTIISVMINGPDSNCYKRTFYNIIKKCIDGNTPYMWLKRFILE